MSARTLSVAACVAAVALAGLIPASASATPIWQTAGPADGDTVKFSAITTYRPAGETKYVVVAAGQDSSTDAPVIYRRLDGVWERFELPAALPKACLSGLAVTATAAWATGNTTSCTTGDPVVLRFPGGGTELAKADTATRWETLTVSGAVTKPVSSVAFAGADGFLGDTDGALYPIHDAGATDAPTVGAGVSYAPAKAVNGIALTDGQNGLVVGDSTLPAGGRIFKLTAGSRESAPFQPSSSGTAVLDVALANGAPVQTRLALEDGAYWRPDENELWVRKRPVGFTDAHLRGVDVVQTPDAVTAVIAGATGEGGAAWVRSGPGTAWAGDTDGWTKYSGLGADLEDTAVVDGSDIWVAGAQGNVRHFAEPPPPRQQDGGGGTGDTGGGNTGGGGSTDTGGGAAPSGDQTPQTVVVEQPAPKSDPPQSQPTQTAPSQQAKPTGRLMRDVRVRVRRGLLIITFRLTAPARVGAKASTAGRLLGLARVRLLGRGKRSIVLRYRGKRPPAQLQLFVRPAAKAATTNRTTK